ncbi:MAG: hypothetical protein GY874_12970 [Desulfobacteraceae bacterium]|nr:hypothetical protein [Desulfobacteraceae bacterium]
MAAYNRRVEAREIYGISATAVIYSGIGVASAALALFMPLALQIIILAFAVSCLIWAAYQAYHHKNALLLKAMRLSAREGRCCSKESVNPF